MSQVRQWCEAKGDNHNDIKVIALFNSISFVFSLKKLARDEETVFEYSVDMEIRFFCSNNKFHPICEGGIPGDSIFTVCSLIGADFTNLFVNSDLTSLSSSLQLKISNYHPFTLIEQIRRRTLSKTWLQTLRKLGTKLIRMFFLNE